MSANTKATSLPNFFNYHAVLLLIVIVLFPLRLKSQCSVVINEIFFAPPDVNGANTSNSMRDAANPNNTAEWVEIYNPSTCNPVDISCWILGSDMSVADMFGNTTQENHGAFVFPNGTVIPPLGFIVVGGAAANPKDFNCQTSTNYSGFNRWFLNNLTGWLALYDKTGAVMDAVYWSWAGANSLNSTANFNNSLSTRNQVTTKCAGTVLNNTLVRNIADLEFAGTSSGNLDEGWKRSVDGGATWQKETHAQSTPKACNATCAQPLNVSAVNTNGNCVNNGSATATATLGYPPYNYSWAPSGGNAATASNLAGGSYTVTVTDACNCNKTATVNIVNNVGQATITVNNPTICKGTSATLTAGGAVTYTWTPGGQSGASLTVTPGSTTNYTVSGTDANGCNGTSTATVTVNPPPTITSSGGAICAGDNYTLTANGASTYAWQPGNGNTASITVNPAASTTYTVIGTDNNDCKDTTTVTVTVNPLPAIKTTGGTMCQGDSVQLSATGADTYLWQNAGGLSSTTIANPYASPATTTTYTVTGTTTAGCKATATATVNIVNNITAVVSPDTAICNGSSAILTGGGGTSYLWTPNTSINNPNSANPIVNPGATTQYTLVVNSGTCSDTAYVTVTVNPIPVVTAKGDTICKGASTQLTATGANTYTWQSSPAIALPAQATVTVNPATSTSYTVTGTANGCSDTALVTVIVLPVAEALVSKDTALCIGETVPLLASGGDTYNWKPATGLNSASIANPMASPSITTTYTVVVSLNNCPPDSEEVKIIIHPKPDVTVSSDTVCAGTPVLLEAFGASNYLWSNGATAASILVVTAQDTSFTVTGTNAGGCKDTAIAKIKTIPVPLVNLTANQYEAHLTDEPVFMFTNNTVNIAPGTIFTWIFGNGKDSLSFASTIAHQYTEAGIYTICLKAEVPVYACRDSNCISVEIIPDWTLFVPNAFTPGNLDELNTEFKAYGTNIKTFHLWVFSRWGNLLYESEDITKGWNGKYQGQSNQLVQQDVYVWKIEFTDIFGKNHNRKGIVTLVK